MHLLRYAARMERKYKVSETVVGHGLDFVNSIVKQSVSLNATEVDLLSELGSVSRRPRKETILQETRPQKEDEQGSDPLHCISTWMDGWILFRPGGHTPEGLCAKLFSFRTVLP